jgi:hypothetical protein
LVTDSGRAAAWVAAAPVCLALSIVAMLLGALVGTHPMWQTRSLNMTEAAAARDVATVALLLERGEDPNEPRPIRASFLQLAGGEMTPLEAGAAAGRLEVVDLLVRRGAAVDAPARLHLACRAIEHGHADVAAYLAGPAPLNCPR